MDEVVNETVDIGTVEAPLDTLVGFNLEIASLSAAGAERFDPVRLHYIKVLAKRAALYCGNVNQENVKQLLDIRLKQALIAFRERFEQAQCDAKDTIAQITPQYPHAAEILQRLIAAGDFKELQRFIGTLKTNDQDTSLNSLLLQLEQSSPANAEGQRGADTGQRTELKTIRNFRNTWSKLSADKQLTQALEQAPKNAGPINSHMLVLRSLMLMRDISPDYLSRFISYADTLLRLDSGEKEKAGNIKKSSPTPKKKIASKNSGVDTNFLGS
ncbi:hypothetical protein LT85_2021 [Collimonas arenae]|uniref:DUF2894 family protein n=1 Tax=Collimonas arenae TaxID=279058 RepID=A0A0A1FBX3_9BURK|nr:DUF2894 domain-containing protein [Collimonas arenae]AIY41179.1 hypothetical protein LT85_2021 [Collimonas arenae]